MDQRRWNTKTHICFRLVRYQITINIILFIMINERQTKAIRLLNSKTNPIPKITQLTISDLSQFILRTYQNFNQFCLCSLVILIQYYHPIITPIMDISFFSDMLKHLDTKSDTIRNTVQYCWANKISADEIMKMMQKELTESRREKRIAFFYVINDLLQNSAAVADLNFVKAVGSKIKSMISEFAKGNENVNDVGSLVKLIEKWHNDQIFASNFTTKLRDIINPVYKRLLDIADQEKPEKQAMKYNKTFLVDYMTVQEFEPTKNQYQDYVTWSQISSKINKFSQQYKKLDTVNPTPEMKERSSELIRIGQEYKNQLIKLVESLHVHYKALSSRCKQEITSNMGSVKDLDKEMD